MIATNQATSEELPKELPSTDDFFFHAADYIYRRRVLFTRLAIALIALLLAGYGVYWYIGYQSTLRDQKIFTIERILKDKNLSETERYDLALPKLTEFITNNGGTTQEIIAYTYRGSLFFAQKEYGKAQADFEKLLTLLEVKSGQYVLVSIYLANVLRDQGKSTEAIQVLQRAQSEIMTDVILMELAETYQETGNQKQAKILLEALKKDHPQSPYQSRADQLLSTM